MEPSWSAVGRRGAASRPPAQQRVVSPGSDSVMRRLGLVIRGHDGLTRMSHGALSLIRLPLPIVPPPRPPAPDGLSSHQGRAWHTHHKMSHGGWSQFRLLFHEEKPGVDQSHRRRATTAAALCGRCRLGVPLPANCRLVWAPSAGRLSSRRRITSVGGPLPGGRRDEAMTSMRCEAKRRRCGFSSRARRRLVGECPPSPPRRPAGRDDGEDLVASDFLRAWIFPSGEICGHARGGIRKNDCNGRRTGFCALDGTMGRSLGDAVARSVVGVP